MAEKATAELLLRIHGEVLGLGKNQETGLVMWDFRIGPFDDDTNQNEHLIVLIHDVEGGTGMTIQITDLEVSGRNPNVRHGGKTKAIACRILGDRVEVVRSDYGDLELESRLRDVLRAVLNKKRLLRKGVTSTLKSDKV